MAFSNYARRAASAVAGALLIALSNAPFAADAPAPAAPTKEMRERMATLHEQMAACLRSSKSIQECRARMMKDCQVMMGSQGCTRMMGASGMKGMGDGMMGMGQGMRDRMTSNPPCNPPK